MLLGAGTDAELKGFLTTSEIQGQASAIELLTTARNATTRLETSCCAAGFFALSDWEPFEFAALIPLQNRAW